MQPGARSGVGARQGKGGFRQGVEPPEFREKEGEVTGPSAIATSPVPCARPCVHSLPEASQDATGQL